METGRIVSHTVVLIRRRDGREIVTREGGAHGDEEQLLSVCGHSRGDGVTVVVNGEQTRTAGSFDDVVRVVEERFAREHAQGHFVEV